jgi:Protein of unknown function (DUF3592)
MTPSLSMSWHDLSHFGRVWIPLLKWPLSFLAGWSAIFIRKWQKTRDENAAQGWPSIEGRIIGSVASRVEKTTRFMVTLEYSFFLEEYHYGKYIHDFSSESDANEFARTMKDKRVQIRYKQSNPEKSVLEQSTIEQHIMLAPRFG